MVRALASNYTRYNSILRKEILVDGYTADPPAFSLPRMNVPNTLNRGATPEQPGGIHSSRVPSGDR